MALAASGVPTATGRGAWIPPTILNMIRHPAYVGDLCANRWQTEKVNGTRRSQRRRPPEEHLVFQDVIPPARLTGPGRRRAGAARSQ
jgi:hypothetical protein